MRWFNRSMQWGVRHRRYMLGSDQPTLHKSHSQALELYYSISTQSSAVRQLFRALKACQHRKKKLQLIIALLLAGRVFLLAPLINSHSSDRLTRSTLIHINLSSRNFLNFKLPSHEIADSRAAGRAQNGSSKAISAQKTSEREREKKWGEIRSWSNEWMKEKKAPIIVLVLSYK